MKKKTKRILIIVAVLVVGLAVGGWFWFGGNSADSDSGVYVQPVSEQNLAFNAGVNRFSGVVEAGDTVNIDPDTNMTVSQVLVKAGDTVTKGQALLRYDTESIRLDIQQLQLDIDQQDITIKTYQAQKEDLERESLSLSADERLSYTARIQQIEVDIATAEYQKKQKQAELKQKNNLLNNAVLTSPIDGTVRSLQENPGMGDPYGEQHFMVLVADGDFRVKGTVSETYIYQLFEGQSVLVRSRVNDDVWNGTISRIDTSQPQQENNNGYYNEGNTDRASKYSFYVDLESPEGLMVGQHLVIEPNAGQTSDMSEGLWLSSGWFVMGEDDSSATVWARGAGNRLAERKVTLGEYNADFDCYRVESGLNEDDYIAWPAEECVSGAPTTTTYVFDEEGMMDGGVIDEGFVDEGFVDEGFIDEGFTDDGTMDPALAGDGMTDGEIIPDTTISAEAAMTDKKAIA